MYSSFLESQGEKQTQIQFFSRDHFSTCGLAQLLQGCAVHCCVASLSDGGHCQLGLSPCLCTMPRTTYKKGARPSSVSADDSSAAGSPEEEKGEQSWCLTKSEDRLVRTVAVPGDPHSTHELLSMQASAPVCGSGHRTRVHSGSSGD
jgi:hypothetical protein